jgi:hypothetical protein
LRRHMSSAAESGTNCRWHGASAKAQCGQDSKLERLARRNRHEPGQRKNLHGTSQRQRFSWLLASGAFTSSLGDSNWESRPTRPQHPTACRSLARRCRASFQRDAARRALGNERHAAG